MDAKADANVSSRLYEGACDCHIHVIGTQSEYPFAADRSYTPQPASLADLDRMHARIGIQRFVIVTPSVYGTDNQSTLDVLRRAEGRARGVAVIDDETSAEALQHMHAQGVRGVRLNMEVGAGVPSSRRGETLSALAGRIEPLGWHLQLNMSLTAIEALSSILSSLPVPMVFDHYAHAWMDGGEQPAGWRRVLHLLESGRAYIKLSAPYQRSRDPNYKDMLPWARDCMVANPERVLWGSNWPHPDVRKLPGRTVDELRPYLDIDDDLAYSLVAHWATGHEERRMVLVENPARLYGF